MKTLIFNGSPRKNGDTITLISEMQKHLIGETKVINAYYSKISPCVDCRFCWRNQGCAINDDMQKIYQDINEFDNIILASPIYFSQLTGEFLSLFSRFQCYYCSRKFQGVPNNLKKKNGVLILTGGGDGNANPAKDTANIIFKLLNIECIHNIFSLNTNEFPANQDVNALQKAREAAIQLNNLYEDSH